jgi:iron complex transport system permease protein
LPFAILVGPIVMLIADVLGRVLAFEGEVQVGIVAALIGGPFFVAVVRRRRIEAL